MTIPVSDGARSVAVVMLAPHSALFSGTVLPFFLPPSGHFVSPSCSLGTALGSTSPGKPRAGRTSHVTHNFPVFVPADKRSFRHPIKPGVRPFLGVEPDVIERYPRRLRPPPVDENTPTARLSPTSSP